MENAVRLSEEKFRQVYENSFRLWSLYHTAAIEQPAIPPSYLDIFNAFPNHPSLPRNLNLQRIYARNRKYSHIYATGRSTWGSTHPDCEHGLPPFHEQVKFDVLSENPVPLSVKAASEDEPHWGS
ncbi:hypothetical protein QBC44DRAFT_391558 [Cladorrhinum sp. PSN332]|nr:hypothetical protein QBC44DRAFT_391558 [Cladorrhinum sp. PSN332]